jgi:polar amino acid transport system permease protein
MDIQLGYLLGGLEITLLMAFASMAFGIVLAIPIFALRLSRLFLLSWIVRAYVDVVRAIPPITWLFIIFYVAPDVGLRLNAFEAGIVGLTVIASAYLSEIYRGAWYSVPRAQWEACAATGMSRFSSIWYVLTPQAFRAALPPGSSYFIGLLKETSVASTIGVTELVYRASSVTATTGLTLEVFLIVGLVYIVVSLPLAFVARRVDRRLRMRLTLA